VAPAVRETRNPGLRDQPDVLRAAPATPRDNEAAGVREPRREPRDGREVRDDRGGRETPKPLPQTRPTPGETNGPAVRPVPAQPVRPVQPRQTFDQPRPAQPMAPAQEAPAARPVRPVQPQQPQQPAVREQVAPPAVRSGGPREERSEAQPRAPQVERRLNERMPERPQRGNERGAAVQER
jgi:hypothetical protein